MAGNMLARDGLGARWSSQGDWSSTFVTVIRDVLDYQRLYLWCIRRPPLGRAPILEFDLQAKMHTDRIVEEVLQYLTDLVPLFPMQLGGRALDVLSVRMGRSSKMQG